MLHHYFKFQKSLILTLGQEGFQILKIQIKKKITDILILRKVGKSLYRLKDHHAFHHCAKFEKGPTNSFGEEGI